MQKGWLTTAIICTVLLLVGCKKYSEDNAIHLTSARARVTNTWHMSAYLENGVDKTNYWNIVFPNYVLELKKDNSFAATANGKYCINSFCIPISMNESGTWALVNNKNDLQLTYSSGGLQTLKMYKLTSKELWVTEIDNSVTKTYKLSAN